jgi:hypothetical protein
MAAVGDAVTAPVAPRVRRIAARLDVVALAAGLAALLLALATSFVPHILGQANNGDYIRLLCQFGLAPGTPGHVTTYFTHIDLRWVPAAGQAACEQRYPSTTVYLLRVARWITGGGAIDLRVVAALQAVIFALAVGALVAALPARRRIRGITALLVLLLLGDTAFLAPFLSAYSEPLGLSLLLAVTAAFLFLWRAPRVRLRHLLATGVLAGLLVFDKAQYAALAVLFVPALLCRPMAAGRWRGRVLPALVAVAVGAAGVSVVTQEPLPQRNASIYDAVFYEALAQGHGTDQQDLAFLHLDPSLAKYAHTFAFAPGSYWNQPGWAPQAEHFSYLRLALLYVRSPGRGLALMQRESAAAAQLRPPVLGSQPVGTGNSYATVVECKVCVTTWLGQHVRAVAFPLLLLLWLAGALAGFVGLRPRATRDQHALGGVTLMIAAAAVVSFLSAVLGEGRYDDVKHLYLADALDTLLLALLPSVAWSIYRRAPRSSRHSGEAAPDPEPALPAHR